ncbi:uncharacterized protein CLUP02_14728 [Colletotrichum lupini]|uniref:Uncharacterized protein n=1 Tax=Colletotrichum lupini TaxID=145971 RepID=A0A9Q8T5I4_9PEZI|nr:uncharacterized protein CLUP02_14728 [Colletotrichum lupini]UQC89200.1 hypothetical protein CLUP02_14728 [Colletotrichum lupini]
MAEHGMALVSDYSTSNQKSALGKSSDWWNVATKAHLRVSEPQVGISLASSSQSSYSSYSLKELAAYELDTLPVQATWPGGQQGQLFACLSQASLIDLVPHEHTTPYTRTCANASDLTMAGPEASRQDRKRTNGSHRILPFLT